MTKNIVLLHPISMVSFQKKKSPFSHVSLYALVLTCIEEGVLDVTGLAAIQWTLLQSDMLRTLNTQYSSCETLNTTQSGEHNIDVTLP